MNDVTVVIPTIAPRARLLARALASISAQTRPVDAISIAQDVHHEGAWATRNRAMAAVATEWTLFLDDDDELYPGCVELLVDRMDEHDLDLAWGWFDVVYNDRVSPWRDLWPENRGRQYDPADPHVVPITYMVRTGLLFEAMGAVGGFLPDEIGAWQNQDKPVFDAMARGGRHMAFPDTVWRWHHDSMPNTSGLPSRWGPPRFVAVVE